jgi:hypothetical protein
MIAAIVLITRVTGLTIRILGDDFIKQVDRIATLHSPWLLGIIIIVSRVR